MKNPKNVTGKLTKLVDSIFFPGLWLVAHQASAAPLQHSWWTSLFHILHTFLTSLTSIFSFLHEYNLLNPMHKGCASALNPIFLGLKVFNLLPVHPVNTADCLHNAAIWSLDASMCTKYQAADSSIRQLAWWQQNSMVSQCVFVKKCGAEGPTPSGHSCLQQQSSKYYRMKKYTQHQMSFT